VSRERRNAEARGRRAELWAAFWLMLKGYRVIALRETTPSGELDLVARKGNVLAIVEVKARPSLEAGIHALGYRQQQRIMRGASWLAGRRRELAGLAIRYDLMVIRPFRLPFHSRQAFWPEGRDASDFN